jgi:RimJ/RimL family protein N-acetyltransferase
MHLLADPCLIRDWRRADKPALVKLANNRNIWRNLAHFFPHPYTESDADGWFDFLARQAPLTHWAIEHQGALAGGIGLILGEGVYSKSARIGYWIGEPFWGRGIATAAVRVVTLHAMAVYALCRVEATVLPWNPASARVLEKAGYVREGVLRCSVYKDGQVIDSLLYARVMTLDCAPALAAPR